MTGKDGQPKLPEFLVEAGAASELELLPELAPQATPADALRRRLLATVEAPPQRYAPFFDRLQGLWGVEEAEVIATLARTADTSAWKRTPLRGVRVIDLGLPADARRSAYLVRFAAGLDYPKHRHTGPESVLLLEGGYRDSLGQVYGPGDLHVMEEGSVHGLHVHADAACICAAVEHGFEFTGPVLRVLQRLVGRGARKR